MNSTNKIKIGICPTMKVFSDQILKQNTNLEIIDLGSAARVLFALSNNELDIGLIGRKAKQREFNGFSREFNSIEGYTLVSNQKGFILENNLSQIKITTSIKKEVIEEKFPKFSKINYYKKLPLELEENETRLISWDDWNDSFELLIPVDEFNNKILDFRKPYFFSKNKSLIENILLEDK